MSRQKLEDLFSRRLKDIEKHLAARIDVGFDHSPFRSLKRRFVVAHTPRVGSHLLCESLLRHGAIVQEFFELPRIENVCANNGFSTLQQYCAWLLTKYAVGGVFGVSGGIKVLAPLKFAGETPKLESDWRFVHLTRLDFVKQAISEIIALRTGAYKSSQAPSRALTDNDFDARAIRRRIDMNLAINAAWEGAFLHHGVTPLRLTYEALSADPAGVVDRTVAFLELEGPAITDRQFLAPALERQATPLNQAWAERFRERNPVFCEKRAAGIFDPNELNRHPP